MPIQLAPGDNAPTTPRVVAMMAAASNCVDSLNVLVRDLISECASLPPLTPATDPRLIQLATELSTVELLVNELHKQLLDPWDALTRFKAGR